MTNYVKTTDFAAKDNTALPDAQRLVKGTEFEVEFDNIADAIASKANSASPAFTGVPTAPTATVGASTTQLATTAFVNAERSATATLTNKTLTDADANTQAFGNNTTKLATTAFVQAALQAVFPVGSIYTSTVATNPNTLFGFGTWVEFGAGKVLVGQNTSDASFDTLEETGGSKDAIAVSHTHSFSATTGSDGSHAHSGTTSSSGSHAHNIAFGYSNDYDYFGNNVGAFTYNGGGVTQNPYNYSTDSGGSHSHSFTTSTASAHTHSVSGTTGATGSSGTNANLQPYVVVKMWKRVS